jgi:TolB protein
MSARHPLHHDPAWYARLKVVVTLMVALLVARDPLAGQAPGSGPALGLFQGSGDIGSPAKAGSSLYNGATQEYTLSSGGVNMWAERDEFQFAWRRMTGDFILHSRVTFHGAGVDPHRKAGWIVRRSLDDNSPYVDGVVHGDGLTSLQYRRAAGALTEQIESAITGAYVVQLERRAGTYILSVAKFGDTFTTTELTGVDLGDEVYVGLFLCSHNADVVERATFSNVRITRPAAANFTPYRDYIGSTLELLDIASGRREILTQSLTQPFEAPNWTTDGGALIFNTSGRTEGRGRLHRFDLMTRQAAVIDTGTNIRNNNDHVLSFDGTMLGISDQSLPGVGSTIYTVPVTGGTPKRITTLAPSYLHGWSPDAKYLVYTGGRGGEFDIYRIASDGSGAEENLTRSKGLDDGPEYTPDGRYIYFNSLRSGTMQIWRMGADGSNPEQITNDAYNNWFPHISPDGTSLVYIAFPGSIDPADHPYYKHVYLRQLPLGGGPAPVIAYVYGGQGTINVPSWSPDGRTIAFVSNTGAF